MFHLLSFKVMVVEVFAFSESFLFILLLLFLHLHEIVEGLCFHFSLSVCVCVCLSLYVYLMFSCEQNSSQTGKPIWTWFSVDGCLPHWQNSIEICDLGSKVKVTMT